MSSGGPFVAPAIPISDPFYQAPGDIELLIYVFWFGGLAFFQLGGVYMSRDNDSVFWRLWLMATMFVGLVSVALYFYPPFDELMFGVFEGSAIYDGLTIYHPARYGIIHRASLVLGAWVVFAAWITPGVTRWLYSIVFDVVDRLDGPEEAEEFEVITFEMSIPAPTLKVVERAKGPFLTNISSAFLNLVEFLVNMAWNITLFAGGFLWLAVVVFHLPFAISDYARGFVFGLALIVQLMTMILFWPFGTTEYRRFASIPNRIQMVWRAPYSLAVALLLVYSIMPSIDVPTTLNAGIDTGLGYSVHLPTVLLVAVILIGLYVGDTIASAIFALIATVQERIEAGLVHRWSAFPLTTKHTVGLVLVVCVGLAAWGKYFLR